ncbi:hypothetical protein AAF712_013010 [Marasmius tenuissimus]|uniref:Uncharacterized protein n=1 Tax=Marasmius tenuissimus TaxID=585030 RepID=A0ABR2ZH00_9AGAR|nr:hypothetical protein PM082_001910 [Marasmius tenuissimus]
MTDLLNAEDALTSLEFSAGEMVAHLFLFSMGFDSFFPLFTPAELKRMTLVNHSFLSAISTFQRRIYKLDPLLLRFFTPTQLRRFRDAQAEDGFLISGSVALQFFANVEWPESDLDLYCYPSHFRRLVKLMVLFGYRFAPSGGTGPSTLMMALKEVQAKLQSPARLYGTMKSVVSVLSFVKDRLETRSKVQIIVCRNSPFEAIFSFHSSVVMNCIGASLAISLYPYSTLHMQEAIQFVSTNRAAEGLQKYEDRGWAIVGSSSVGAGLHHASELTRDRMVGDSASWIIPLNGASMSPNTDSDEYKWFRAHSWSHVSHTAPPRICILSFTGSRCGWKWRLTYSQAAKYLIMHQRPRKTFCGLCEEQTLQQVDAHVVVQAAVQTTPRVTHSALDRTIVDFLRGFFNRLPLRGPLNLRLLPDSETAFAMFQQMRGILTYYRTKPQITLSFDVTAEPSTARMVEVKMEIFLPQPGGAAVSIASIHPIRGRSNFPEGLQVQLNMGPMKQSAPISSDRYTFGTNFGTLASPTQLSTRELPYQQRVMLEDFVRELMLSMPKRDIQGSRLVPVPECKKQLLGSLNALFLLLDCEPNLSAAFFDKGQRTDIAVFTVITVKVPEEWPDLDRTAFGVLYNIDVVRSLQSLGFSVHIVKGGRSFM